MTPNEQLLNVLLMSIAAYQLLADGIHQLHAETETTQLQDLVDDLNESGITHRMQTVFNALLEGRSKALAASANAKKEGQANEQHS